MRSKTLLFLNILWVFTILYFCTGRYEWNIPSYFTLIFYLVICFGALNLGYFTGPKAKPQLVAEQKWEEDRKQIFYKYRRPFAFACIVTIFFQIMWVITFLGEFLILNVIETLGENYFARMEAEFSEINHLMRIRTLTWVITYFVFPMGMMFFKSMPLRYKILFIVTVAIEILASLNMGVSKNMGDLVIIGLAVMFLNGGKNPQEQIDLEKKKKQKGVFLRVAIILVIFFGAFSLVQNMRSEVSTSRENPYGYLAHIRSTTIYDYILGKGSAIGAAFDSMGTYISHAYCGLAYAMELPFENTYGLGFSKAMMDYAESYFGISGLVKHTYNFRLEDLYGWRNGQWWPTAFVWIGNAVSLWFVPLVTFLLGRFFAVVERRWYEQRQILCLVWFCQLMIAFIYLSCNAQIVQGRHILIATICLALMYVVRYVFRFKFTWRK